MIPEFIGRLPVVAALDPLSEDELMMILTDTKNALVKQYAKLLSIEGVTLNVTRTRSGPWRARRQRRQQERAPCVHEGLCLDVNVRLPAGKTWRRSLSPALVRREKAAIRRRKQDRTQLDPLRLCAEADFASWPTEARESSIRPQAEFLTGARPVAVV